MISFLSYDRDHATQPATDERTQGPAAAPDASASDGGSAGGRSQAWALPQRLDNAAGRTGNRTHRVRLPGPTERPINKKWPSPSQR